MIGHGTGSIRTLFEKAAAGQAGAAGVAAANPHNQTLAVGINWRLNCDAVGDVGGASRTISRQHACCVDRCLIVVQNLVGSLFNSHLFDFV